MITQLLVPMPSPIIVHSNSSGHSGPWTESDTNLAIAVWAAFLILGLIGFAVDYTIYRKWKRHSGCSDSFFDFIIDANGTLFGYICMMLSLIVSAIYAVSLLIYGIYSILQ